LGSRRDRPPFEFIAGKRSVKFRFPEADIYHRVLTTDSVENLAIWRKGWAG